MNDKARPRVFDAKSRWSWSSSVARASLRRTAWANPRKQVRSQVPTCRRKRKGIVSRLMVVLRFRRDLKRCGDFLLEEPHQTRSCASLGDQDLRSPGGAIALELPNCEPP